MAAPSATPSAPKPIAIAQVWPRVSSASTSTRLPPEKAVRSSGATARSVPES